MDEILRKIQENEKRRQEDDDEELYVDPRKNLAFYARPPRHIRELVGEIQQELRNIAPSELSSLSLPGVQVDNEPPQPYTIKGEELKKKEEE